MAMVLQQLLCIIDFHQLQWRIAMEKLPSQTKGH